MTSTLSLSEDFVVKREHDDDDGDDRDNDTARRLIMKLSDSEKEFQSHSS